MKPRTLNVSIIASGGRYQEAAALAAATYRLHLSNPGKVTVFLPEQENPVHILKANSQRFRFAIRTFPFDPIKAENLTSQLKCKGFWHAVSTVHVDELLLLADADTYCLKPLRISAETEAAIFPGKIGLVRDVNDLHSQKPEDPWFVPKEERASYVNSGVILASRNATDIFRVFFELSRQPQFLRPRCQDQGIINFAIGKFFRNRLFLLDGMYNRMGFRQCAGAIIGHCAGGPGHLGGNRKASHAQLCATILNSVSSIRPWLPA